MKQKVAKLRQELARLNETKIDFERQVRKLTLEVDFHTKLR